MDPTKRFGDRVADYARYRPDYPEALLDRLEPPRRVVELGAGTGILTVQLLARGHEVTAVEPNGPMRAACARLDARVVDGTAEATGLPAGCAELVVAAQAFHWFEPEATRREVQRLLVEGGEAWLIWNDRVQGPAHMEAYEALLRRHNTDYGEVARKDVRGAIRTFFPEGFVEERLPHHQDLDRSGLHGRIASCSYVPAPGAPGHPELVAATERLFDEHAADGVFRLDYETLAIHGRP